MFKKKSHFIKGGLTVLISVLIIYGVAQAGSLTPSASPAATMNSLADIAGSGFATATHSLKALYDKINSLVTDIWNKQTSELTTTGSVGKLLVDNIDTTISSRLAASSYVTERGTDNAMLAASYVTERGTDNAALASNYTATRAGYLDTLKTGPRGPVVAASAESASTYTHANAAKYCYDLSAAAAVAMDGDTSTTYTDWRLPTVGEAAVFEGTITSTNYIWTATVYEATGAYWILLKLSDGLWTYYAYNSYSYVRCVR